MRGHPARRPGHLRVTSANGDAGLEGRTLRRRPAGGAPVHPLTRSVPLPSDASLSQPLTVRIPHSWFLSDPSNAMLE